MKQKNIIFILSILLCLSLVLSSCSYISSDEQDESEIFETEQKGSEARIKELEAQIITLLQSQEISESERKKEISALKSEIEALKNKSSELESASDTDNEASSIFKYTLNGYKATITSINTDEESIIIPAVINGHAIVGIGSNVIVSKKVKRIVLSDGIETLDWFAFKDCSSLSYISIPASVSSIGYGAFDGTAKGLTIECEKDSFAHKYAQSYGFKSEVKQKSS